MDRHYEYIYGKHAVLEAVKLRPDVIKTLYLRNDILSTFDTGNLDTKCKINSFVGDAVPKEVPKQSVHQGYVAVIDTNKLILKWDDFIEGLTIKDDTGLMLLGEIQDPHNVGAVIRNAAAFGATAVLVPEHRQAGVTGTVLKVSAGMAFAVPLVEVANVNRVLKILKDKGFFVYGLDAGGDTLLQDEDFRKPSVFVLGNEGGGIRQKTKEACDIVLKIAMHPRCESLNASVSSALVLNAWSQRHPTVLE
ncbi:23S rRNA (guanosine(2251)-2'-O)-methyltransferase RlmB [Candidatus Kaiserbacteria bacterium]|nr:23S rRNA (guanosine(2251)-2'-O)-methyltransferase RlmB [Candidatus Kaiserbacteria bacterium]